MDMDNQSMQKRNQLAPGAEKTLQSLEFRMEPEFSPATAPRPIEIPSRRWFLRWRLPILLLIASVLSMTWAGLTVWSPVEILEAAFAQGSLFEVRRSVLANWIPGLLFSLALTAILGSHELGHYLVTRGYGIRSTPPLFIPFPISPIGTCGAVILMDGRQADRRQIFDIGIAGPLAGMVIAIPIAIAGLLVELPLRSGGVPSYIFGQPLLIQGLSQLVSSSNAIPIAPAGQMISLWGEGGTEWVSGIANIDMNPLLMAAWVGMLVTGLNMIPISQLDGGHVIFGLLGQRSRIFCWCTYLACIGYVIYGAVVYRQGLFVVMLLLVSLMGIAHPPSRDDNVVLGTPRQILGWLTLLLPILCIPLRPVTLAF
jgi:membrane-associated protease RseP (regulator of RpoE activity)